MSTSSGRKHVSMGLQWKHVNFSVESVGDTKDAPKTTKHVLSDMSGHAEPGALLAIMGPSGAGKTSLLNALARLNPQATGEILLNGRPWEDSFDKLTAYMHQDERLMPDLTVQEHLEFQARCRLPAMSAAKRTQLVDSALSEMGLEWRRDARIGDAVTGAPHISKNERKRLNYATEILSEPSLLFVDEPTTGLDSFMAEIVVNDLKRLAAGSASDGAGMFDGMLHGMFEALFDGTFDGMFEALFGGMLDRMSPYACRPGLGVKTIAALFWARCRAPKANGGRDDPPAVQCRVRALRSAAVFGRRPRRLLRRLPEARGSLRIVRAGVEVPGPHQPSGLFHATVRESERRSRCPCSPCRRRRRLQNCPSRSDRRGR